MNLLRNSVQLIGRLGRDPEFNDLGNGRKLVKFSIATSEPYKNQKGEKIENTQWHNIIAWGKTAEMMNEFLQKGSEVLVRGKIVYDSYEDKKGLKRTSTKIQVSEFISLDKSKKMQSLQEVA